MNGYSCQNDIFYSEKFGGYGSIWNHRTKMFFSCFLLPTPQKEIWHSKHPQIAVGKSSIWWDLAQKDERFSMVLCFFGVLGRSESCLFLWATKKWSPKGTPHRNGTPDEREALREYLKTNGCGSLADRGEQVTERRFALSPRNGSEKIGCIYKK